MPLPTADRAGLISLRSICANRHKCSSAFVALVLPAIRRPCALISLRSICASVQVSSSGNLLVKNAVMHGAAPCAQTLCSPAARKGFWARLERHDPGPRKEGRQDQNWRDCPDPSGLCQSAQMLLRICGFGFARDTRALCARTSFSSRLEAMTPALARRAGVMADRAGFEPAETLLPHTLSKRAHSTTLPPVQVIIGRDMTQVLGRRKLAGERVDSNPFLPAT